MQQLRELDEEFRANNIEIIKRFYLLFESIHAYITDLNHYIEELEDGVYIHQSLETVFQDVEGKQLLVSYLFSASFNACSTNAITVRSIVSLWFNAVNY